MFVKMSYPLYEGAPIGYFTTVQTRIIPTLRIANGDASNNEEVHLFTHNGTHMDAPWHFNLEGKQIDELDVEDWVFNNPKTIDVSSRPNRDVDRSDIEPFFSENDDSDLLLIFSGLSRIRESNTKEYTDNFPGLTTSAAKFIIEETKLRGIALDFMSVESAESMRANIWSVHRTLLGRRDVSQRSIVIIEDVNLAPILGKKIKRVFAAPLLIKGIGGSPVNMFAEID